MQNKEHIVITKLAPAMGGAEMYTLNLIEALIADHKDILLITDNITFARDAKKKHAKVRIMSWYKEPVEKKEKVIFFLLFLYYTIRFFLVLYTLKRRNSIDLLYAQTMSDKLYATIPAYILRIPIVWIEHGPISPWFGNAYTKVLYKCTALFTYAIICVSYKTKEDIAMFAIPSKKLHVIQNGINPKIFYPISIEEKEQRKKEFNIPHAFSIGYIGRLDYAKGIDILIKLSQHEKLCTLPIQWIIFGEGNAAIELMLKQEQQQRNNFFFFGKTSQPESIFPLFDISILPSQYKAEGLPLAVLESLFCHTPVIASDIGGIGEVVITDKTGILVDPTDIDAFAHAIIRCMDTAYLENIKNTIDMVIKPQYTCESMYKKTHTLFKQAMYGK